VTSAAARNSPQQQAIYAGGSWPARPIPHARLRPEARAGQLRGDLRLTAPISGRSGIAGSSRCQRAKPPRAPPTLTSTPSASIRSRDEGGASGLGRPQGGVGLGVPPTRTKVDLKGRPENRVFPGASTLYRPRSAVFRTFFRGRLDASDRRLGRGPPLLRRKPQAPSLGSPQGSGRPAVVLGVALRSSLGRVARDAHARASSNAENYVARSRACGASHASVGGISSGEQRQRASADRRGAVVVRTGDISG
jgi:hypothetical protein